MIRRVEQHIPREELVLGNLVGDLGERRRRIPAPELPSKRHVARAVAAVVRAVGADPAALGRGAARALAVGDLSVDPLLRSGHDD